jgi:hypothetical protein
MRPTPAEHGRTTAPIPDPFEITLDFRPLRQPDSRTYNRIINRLFNVTLQAIHTLHALEQADKAVQIAEPASQALQDYDEDLAEVTLRAAKEREQSPCR